MRAGAATTTMLALLTLWSAPGCGGPAELRGAPTFPVKGKVTYRGKPLTQGSVTFEPDGAGKEANGPIQPDGTFILTTYKPGDGAVAGLHRVAIAFAGKSIPIRYAHVSSSRIEVQVTEGTTDYPIDLK